MNVLVVDDNENIRSILTGIINNIENVNIVGEAGSGIECINLLEEKKPDVIFLDIEMKDMSGVEIGYYISANYPDTLIVFVTGHVEYGPNAFEMNAIDYIVKPFNQARVLTAILKARKRLAEVNKHGKLTVKQGSNIFIIDLKSIILVEKVLKKSIVHTDNEKIEINDSLRSLMERLPENVFMKTHQSYIVNVSKVKGLVPFNPVSYTIRFMNTNETALLLRSKYGEFCKMLTGA